MAQLLVLFEPTKYDMQSRCFYQSLEHLNYQKLSKNTYLVETNIPSQHLYTYLKHRIDVDDSLFVFALSDSWHGTSINVLQQQAVSML
jgi:hypothetical protein